MTSTEEFREFGKAMIDYVADYLENISDRPVLPSVKPGYLQQLVPTEAPDQPERWQVRRFEKRNNIIKMSVRLNNFTFIPFTFYFYYLCTHICCCILGCNGRH